MSRNLFIFIDTSVLVAYYFLKGTVYFFMFPERDFNNRTQVLDRRGDNNKDGAVFLAPAKSEVMNGLWRLGGIAGLDVFNEFPTKGEGGFDQPVIVALIVQILQDQPILAGAPRQEPGKKESHLFHDWAEIGGGRLGKGEID
ncbi:MAG TPA: hypothetical protein PLU95_09860 [Syntrophales bacterium]|jgi:hypothetical protein|nr:hypothetical protein [Syntrophales bacterium]